MSQVHIHDSRAKVLFVTFTADWGGPTNSLLLLLKHLRCRFDVAVLLPDEGPLTQKLTQGKIPFFSLPSLTKWSIPSIFRLIRRERFDLVYGNTTHGASRNALLAAKLAGVPFICHLRSVATAWPWSRYAFLNLTDAVIACSSACSDSLLGRVSERKVRVVYNGIDVDDPKIEIGAAESRLRKELGLSDDRPVLINVGRLIHMKGQEYAVRLVAAAISRGVDINLLLVGGHQDRRYVDRIETLISELGVGNRVKLTGFRKDIPTLLSISDILIHPSLDEAHPRAVLEAMAAGIPVVAFDVDGVSETVVDGETGYLLPIGDVSGMVESGLRLTEDSSVRARMGREGRRRVEDHFSARVTADQVSQVILELVSRKSGEPRLV